MLRGVRPDIIIGQYFFRAGIQKWVSKHLDVFNLLDVLRDTA